MLRSIPSALLPLMCLGALTACSTDGGLGGNLTTSSINQQAAKKPAIDPACVTLVSKIDSLRKDGITDRVAKAGAGKSKTVSVYRKSLAQMAELDRANAEYQLRCGKLKPGTATARVTPPPAPKAVPAKAAKAPATKTATTAVQTTKTVAKTTAEAAKAKASTAVAKKVAPVKTVAEAKATEVAKKATAAPTTATATTTAN